MIVIWPSHQYFQLSELLKVADHRYSPDLNVKRLGKDPVLMRGGKGYSHPSSAVSFRTLTVLKLI